MASTNTLADHVWDTLWTPIYWMWPKSVRDWVARIPEKVLWGIIRFVYTLCFYGLIVWLMKDLFTMPIFMTMAWEKVTNFPNATTSYLSQVYAQMPMVNPLTLLITVYAHLLAFIAWLRKSKEAPPAKSWWAAERAMQGSDFIPHKSVIPKFQATLSDEEGKFRGMCFRVENAVLTAAHVIEGSDGEYLNIATQLGTVRIAASRFEVLPYLDTAFVKLDEKEFSILGLVKGNLANIAVLDGDSFYAACYGLNDYSMGSVNANNSFGMVTYTGSTTHGYSGAPYVSHKTIYGMHTGAGLVNLGISAAYLRMRLSTQLEDTADWLEEEISKHTKRGQKIDYRTSPGDPDMVEFKVGREYHMIDADIFYKVYKPHGYVQVHADPNLAPMETYPNYNDSKNSFRAPVIAPAGATGKISESVSTAAEKLDSRLPQTLIIPETALNYNMDTPILTPAQQSVPSNTTSNIISNQLERKKNRPNARARKQLKLQLNSIVPTRHGLEMLN